jgi:RNA polymerase sigma-70 factor, ECF subfamily
MFQDCEDRDERLRFERSVMPLTQVLRSSALRLSRSPADADDLVQETVLKAWRFWPRYTDRESCRAWLHSILRNTFLSQRRRAGREREVLSEAGHTHADEKPFVAHALPEPDRDGLDDGLTRSLAALRTEQRTLLWLVDVEERSYREAADQLGLPIGTVMSRLHRARAALRGAFLQPESALTARLT